MKQEPILEAIKLLINEARTNNPARLDVSLAIGEVFVQGQEYQLVFTLVADKAMWHNQGGFYFSSSKVMNQEGTIDSFIKSYIKKDQ